jgi:hypothetical protein
MSDLDEIRTALSDALRLPGEVHARPGAASTIRARARSRRRATIATLAMAVPAFLVIVALLVNGSGSGSTSLPATKGTATPSASPTEVDIPSGPRELATPIEIRPVLREYLLCPANSHTVPAVEGAGCYRLGPAALVIRRVRDLGGGIRQGANGAAGPLIGVDVRMTARDAVTFSDLTAASLHEQVAFVVNGKVRAAPSIEGHITEGVIQITVAAGAAEAFVTELTG